VTQSIGEPVRKAIQAFRKQRRTKVLKTFAAGAAVAGVVFAAAPASVASASVIPAAGGEATIGRPIKLAGQSIDGFAVAYGSSGSGSRSILLNAGWYNWGYTLSGPSFAQDSRQIFLKAGWYNWQCYLSGTTNAWPAINYDTECSLSLQGSSGAWLPGSFPSAGVGDLHNLAPGDYAWTGYLQYLHQ
jgi:hypothetical protein